MWENREDIRKILVNGKVEEMREILIASMREKIASGWTLQQKVSYLPQQKICCALGSLLNGDENIMKLFCFSEQENNCLYDIINGFDGRNIHRNSEWNKLGIELWERFKLRGIDMK